MSLEILPLVTYILVGIFSPGPNNISSACMGVTYGYFRLIPFLAGISIGFLVVMLLSAGFCTMTLETMSGVQTIIRWLGVGFILWLAFKLLFTDYNQTADAIKRAEFRAGFCLQMVNVKTVVFGINLYSTFLASVRQNPGYLVLSVLIIAMLNFASVSFWACCGAMVRRKLANPVTCQNINRVLALLMVYIAVELSGVMDFIAKLP